MWSKFHSRKGTFIPPTSSPVIRFRPVSTRKPFPLWLEILEDRWSPSTYVVTNLLDDGSNGSLRWAVAQANAHQGEDSITFGFS